MKKLNKYGRAALYLDKIFNLVNENFFENKLEKPIITIQSTPKAYGHVSVSKVWQADGTPQRELNIGAGTLNIPVEEIVATIIHEGVHIYCMDNGIQDVSRNGTYHNEKFKVESEKRTLIHPTKSEKYGWTLDKSSDKTLEFCLKYDLEEFLLYRIENNSIGFGVTGTHKPPLTTTTGGKKQSSTIKYKCPKCGISVRATKQVNIICADCNERMTNDGLPF